MKTIYSDGRVCRILRIVNLWVERMIGGVVFSNEGISWHRRHLRGRSQPGRAAHHGNGFDRGDSSREAQTLQGSRHLPNDGASIELVDDRTGDVAVAPATSEASPV